MTPIAALLDRIGWATGELATRLEISPDTVSQWARGRREPPPSVLGWLAEIDAALASVDQLPPGWEGLRPGRRSQALPPD